MKYIIILLSLFLLIVQDINCLTMEGLFRKLKERRVVETMPDIQQADMISSMANVPDKSYIRPIGSVAGREIIPRRWTYGEPISDVFVDENGIAIPVRRTPNLANIMRSRGGLY